MVYSSSYILALKKFGDGFYFLKRQFIFAGFGITLMLIVANLRYEILNDWKCVYLLLTSSLITLLLVLIPGFGSEIGDARRWFRVGNISFQPSEFAKLTLIIYLSYSLAKKGVKVKTFSLGLLPHLMISLIMGGLILKQPDLGGGLIMLALLFLMLFLAWARISHLVSLGLVSLPVLYFLVISFPYRIKRILAFLNPFEDPEGTGYQIIQSFLAFGSGGFWGLGLGNSRQKLFYLPEPHTDFIFSIIGEELGFLGVSIILFLFLVLIFCGFKTSLRAKDLFGAYLALGITSLIGLGAIVNMTVATGLLPTKGACLPFVSYGGSSLVVSLISSGILLSISQRIRR